jgi:hypothetical protein
MYLSFNLVFQNNSLLSINKAFDDLFANNYSIK